MDRELQCIYTMQYTVVLYVHSIQLYKSSKSNQFILYCTVVVVLYIVYTALWSLESIWQGTQRLDIRRVYETESIQAWTPDKERKPDFDH